MFSHNYNNHRRPSVTPTAAVRRACGALADAVMCRHVAQALAAGKVHTSRDGTPCSALSSVVVVFVIRTNRAVGIASGSGGIDLGSELCRRRRSLRHRFLGLFCESTLLSRSLCPTQNKREHKKNARVNKTTSKRRQTSAKTKRARATQPCRYKLNTCHAGGARTFARFAASMAVSVWGMAQGPPTSTCLRFFGRTT
jgi:hypothetical protein